MSDASAVLNAHSNETNIFFNGFSNDGDIVLLLAEVPGGHHCNSEHFGCTNKSFPKIREAAFDFTYSFKCPDTVFVNRIFQCNLTVLYENRVRATVQWQGRPPLSHEFTEQNLLPLGVASLKRYEGSFINCALPENFAYGPVTFESGHLRSIAISTDGDKIKFIHDRLSCPDGSVVDYENRMCSNGNPVVLDTHVIWTTPYPKSEIQPYEIQDPCNFLKGDEIRIESANNMKCVRVNNLNPYLPTDSLPAIQLNLYLNETMHFYGSFIEEGVHTVIAILEPYAWEQEATPKRVEVPISVLPSSTPLSPGSGPAEPIIGGISIFEKVGSKLLSGCGRRFDIFNRRSVITFKVNIIEGRAREVKWCLRSRQNIDQYFEETVAGIEYTANFVLAAGQYSITAVANGDDGLSLQANRFFEILDNEDFILACKNYRQNIMDGTELIWSFPEVWPMRLRFEILHRTGNFHYFPWNNQRICLSPKLRFNSLLSSDTNEKIGFLWAKVNIPAEKRAFEVAEMDSDICIPAAELKINELYEVTVYANTSTRIGRDTHRIRLGRSLRANLSIRQEVCLLIAKCCRVMKPRFTAETLAIRSPEHVVLRGAIDGDGDYKDAEFHWHFEMQFPNSSIQNVSEEMMHFTEGSKTNTLVILPDFLRQLPVQGQLDACMRVNHPHLENLKSCLTVDVWSATTCDHCSLEAPNFIREFQRACMTCSCPPILGKFEFYAKMHEDQITLGIAENPSFCSMLPLVEEDIRMCIRSLPSSSLYINKCSHALRFTRSTPDESEKQMNDILTGKNDILEKAIGSKDANTISETVQAICAQIRGFMNSDLPPSLPAATDQKRNRIAQLTEKLVGALESVSLANYENLLPLSSGLEAIATIATEITFTTMNRIQSKLAEAAYVLPQLLSESSFKSVYELARRFTKTAVYLLEGMRYQHENPTPALKSIQQQELDYETDIDADPIDSLDTLILNNLRGAQILSAKAMTGVLAKIDALLASSFHEVLVPGGSMFQEIFSTHNSVRFCRVMTRDLSNDHVACGESKIGIPNVTDLLNYEDIVVRTSSFTDNIYDFFNRGQDNPGSNLVSLTFYAEGAALNLSDTKFPFRFTLRKDTNASGCTNSDLEFEEQEVQLPEPVVAVDGTLVYQLLIMHRFEVDQEEANFVFQLHPSETATCPQYLVVARYTIPPNLQVVDDYGSFYWAMLPSSTLACKNVSTSGKMQQIYSLYIYPDVLSKLKNEAVARTRHLKIRTEELKHFYIGYRQLSASELNCYDERNPPPVPYLFRGRINTTAYVSASMPSCLHITPGEDAWRRSGCKAVSSPNSDEVLCECTHLTTFAVGISPMFESAQFKYILQGEHSMRISIPVYVVIVAIVSSTLLMVFVSRKHERCQVRKFDINSGVDNCYGG
uniref:Polycystin 1 n=1 Tax=Echinococcus granulosus TaxID=6210 RepID=A0A068WUF9_ECHGR|nr:polycystin 1 [Echinococcus granulosus]